MLKFITLTLILLCSTRAFATARLDFAGATLAARIEPADFARITVALWPKSRETIDTLSVRLRRGWLRAGVPAHVCESILVHDEDVVRAFLIAGPAEPDVEIPRGAWMTWFHDFVESRGVPDIIPADQISPERKFRLEHAVLREIVRDYGPGSGVIMDLWLEFEANKTPTAVFVFQLDALDATVKACAYETMGYDVAEFFESVVPRITHSKLKRVLDRLLAARGRAKFDYRQYYFELLARTN